jgi:hypothetical protein
LAIYANKNIFLKKKEKKTFFSTTIAEIRDRNIDPLFVDRPVATRGPEAEQGGGPALLLERRLHHPRHPHRHQVGVLRRGERSSMHVFF